METKKQVIFVLIAGLLILAMLSLVLAAKPEQLGMNASLREAKEAKNITFGQCVVVGVEAKNTCYASANDAKTSCIKNAANSTDTKTEVKACSSKYKNAKNECKKVFKSAKNECKKIKHNFFESTRYAFA